ncbi:MAG: response regulator, partial [Thiohalocapsa sp.]
MAKTVLIIHPDAEMILEIQDQLDEIGRSLGVDVRSKRARSHAEALAAAEKDGPDLVITETEIPPGDIPVEAAGEHAHRGLTTIRELRARYPDLNAILITGHVDDTVFEFSQTEVVGLVREGGGFRDSLDAQIRQRLGGQAPAAKNQFELEIVLAPEGGGCFYQFQQQGQPCHTPRRLSVDTETLLSLVRKSRRVHIDEPEWEEELREIGEDLAYQLFLQRTPDNLQFLEDFNQKVGEVKGVDNIRIRFVVDSKLHPIAFEALKRKGQDYLMLRTPIYRRIDNRSDILS